MRIVVQRSKAAEVRVAGEQVGYIKSGLVLLVGVTHEDTEQDAKWLADKVAGLRIFEDSASKMNLSVKETGGQVLVVSQFTLYGDCRKGRRPNFMQAALPEHARQLVERLVQLLQAHGLHVETGQFGANMDVTLTNAGPVTLLLDSRE